MDKPRKTERPRRRWFQYSIRTLLLLTAAISVWLGLETSWARHRERVIARVQELGGKTGTYYRVTGTEENAGPTWFWSFVGEGYAVRIADIDLMGTNVTDEDLEDIGSLRRLQIVSLDDCGQITDHGLACLKGTNLACLSLGTTSTNEYHITPCGIQDIADCPTLDGITFTGPHVDDTWLASLHNAKQLKILYVLGDTKVTQARIAALKRALPQLDIQTPATMAESLGLPADALRPCPAEELAPYSPRSSASDAEKKNR